MGRKPPLPSRRSPCSARSSRPNSWFSTPSSCRRCTFTCAAASASRFTRQPQPLHAARPVQRARVPVLRRPAKASRGRPVSDLAPLAEQWTTLREEAQSLFDEGRIRALANNDVGFNSFFKRGWKRFCVKWYGDPLASAQALCPRTVALCSRPFPRSRRRCLRFSSPARTESAPRSVRRLASLPSGAGDAQLGRLLIVVDGERYSWRDGEAVMFDGHHPLGGQQDADDAHHPVLRRRAAANQQADDADQPVRDREFRQDQRDHKTSKASPSVRSTALRQGEFTRSAAGSTISSRTLKRRNKRCPSRRVDARARAPCT